MTFEPPRTRHERNILSPMLDLRSFAKRVVMLGIDAAADKTDMKGRIMLAWEHGHLTEEEAEVLIVARGLLEA